MVQLATTDVVIKHATATAEVANDTATTAQSTADTASSTASLAKDKADKANEAAALAAQQAADAIAASGKLNTDLSKQINDNKAAADQSIAEAKAAIESANTNLTTQISAANDAITKAKTDLEKADADIKQSITDTQQQVVDAQNAAVQSATDLANQAKVDAISTAQTNINTAQATVQANVDKANTAITNANTAIANAKSDIAANADKLSKLGDRVTTTETTLVKQDGLIATKVAQTDFNIVSDSVNGLSTRMASAESSITQTKDQIATKVSSTDMQTALATKQGNVTRATTAPTSPTANQLWMDTSKTPNVLMQYDGTAKAWVKASATTAAEVGAYSSSDGVALATRLTTAESSITQTKDQIATKVSSTDMQTALATKQGNVTRATTAPTSPTANQLWMDTSKTPNVLMQYDGTAKAWVKASATTAAEVGAYSSSDGVALATRLTTAESSITQTKDQIALKVSQTDFDNYKTTTDAKVNSLGQVNQLFNTEFNPDLSGWETSTADFAVRNGSVNGSSSVKITNTTTTSSWRYIRQQVINVKAGDVLSLSAYFSGISASRLSMNIDSYVGPTRTIVKGLEIPKTSDGLYKLENAVIPSGSEKVYISFWVYAPNDTAIISQPMLVFGSTVGAYVQGNYNNNAAIDALSGRMTIAESSITQTKDQIALKVSSADFDNYRTTTDTKINSFGQINNVVNSEFDDNFNGWFFTSTWPSITRVAGYNGSFGARLDASSVAADDGNYRVFSLEDTQNGLAVNVPAGAKTVSFKIMGYIESLASSAYVNGIITAVDSAGKTISTLAVAGNTFKSSIVGAWQESSSRYFNMNIPDGTVKIKINNYLRGQGVVIISQPMVVFDSPTVGAYVPGPLINAGRLTVAESSITQLAGQISLKANQTVVDGLSTRTTNAESSINAINGTIKNKVDQSVYDAKTGDLTTRLASAEQSLTGFKTTVADVQNKVNSLGQINQLMNTEFVFDEKGLLAGWASKVYLTGWATDNALLAKSPLSYNGSGAVVLDRSTQAVDSNVYTIVHPLVSLVNVYGHTTMSYQLAAYIESVSANSNTYFNGNVSFFAQDGVTEVTNSDGTSTQIGGGMFTKGIVGAWQLSKSLFQNITIPVGAYYAGIKAYPKGQFKIHFAQPMLVFDEPAVGTYVQGNYNNNQRLSVAEQTIDGFKQFASDGNGNIYSDFTTALRATKFFAGMDGTQSIRDQTSSQITDSVTNGAVRTALNFKADTATLASYALVTSVPVVTTGGTAPSSPKKGDVWVNTAVMPAANMTYTGSAWVQSGIKITTASSAPTSPAPVKGDVWVNTAVTPNQVMVYNGSTWVTTGDPDATAKGAALQVSVDKITSEVFDSKGKSIISQQADQIAAKVSQTDFSTWKSTVDWTKVTTLNDLNTYITTNHYLYAATTAVANQPVGGWFYFEVIAVSGAKIQQRVYKDNNSNSQWVRTSNDGTGSSWSAWEQIGTMSSVFTQTAGQIASTVSNEVMSSTWSQTKNGILTTAQNAAKGLKTSFNVGSDGTITASVSDTQKGLNSTDLQTAMRKTTLLSDADGNQSLITQTKSSWTADIKDAKTGLEKQITAGDDGVLATVTSLNQVIDSSLNNGLDQWTDIDANGASNAGRSRFYTSRSVSCQGVPSVGYSQTALSGDYSTVATQVMYKNGWQSFDVYVSVDVQVRTMGGTSTDYLQFVLTEWDSSNRRLASTSIAGTIRSTNNSWTNYRKKITLNANTDHYILHYQMRGNGNFYIARPYVGTTELADGAYIEGQNSNNTTVLGLFDGRFALGIQNNQGLITSGVFGDVNGMTITGKTVTIDANTTVINNLNANNITAGKLNASMLSGTTAYLTRVNTGTIVNTIDSQLQISAKGMYYDAQNSGQLTLYSGDSSLDSVDQGSVKYLNNTQAYGQRDGLRFKGKSIQAINESGSSPHLYLMPYDGGEVRVTYRGDNANNGYLDLRAMKVIAGNITLNGYHSIISDDAGKMYVTDSKGNSVDLGVRSLTQSSLVSLKENIRNVETDYALAEVLKSDVRQYNFKTDDKQAIHVSPMIDDVDGKLYIPKDWVSADGDSVDTYNIIGYLIQSIKELNKQIVELKGNQ